MSELSPILQMFRLGHLPVQFICFKTFITEHFHTFYTLRHLLSLLNGFGKANFNKLVLVLLFGHHRIDSDRLQTTHIEILYECGQQIRLGRGERENLTQHLS